MNLIDLIHQARKTKRCAKRVVAYVDGRTARCMLTAGHEGRCR